MKLTFLGTGSPEAYARRASSGYLLEIGNDRLLFDCGGGVVDRLISSGRSPADVTHLVLSHLHSDHMLDYPRLVHGAWDAGAPPLLVWGPAPIAQITDGYFGRSGVLRWDLMARTELAPSQAVWKARGGTLPRPWPTPKVTEIGAGDPIEGDGWRIETCEVPHAQPALMCLAFRIFAGGRSLVYSGDAGTSEPFEQFCAGADMLLHWCYRLDGEEVSPEMASLTPTPSETAAMARRAGVGKLVLTHFRVHMDARRDEALAAAAESFGGPVSVAEDLGVVEV
ncbi:MAG: MBL fold metallo-hydrolase [Pseudomonadota bacterium]